MYYKIVYEEGIQIGQQKNLPTNGIEITKEEYESILLDKKAHAELLDEHFNKVKNGEITIDEIENEEDRAEIQRRIDAEPQNDYGISDETYNSIIDDYTTSLTEEVSQNGYY